MYIFPSPSFISNHYLLYSCFISSSLKLLEKYINFVQEKADELLKINLAYILHFNLFSEIFFTLTTFYILYFDL